MDREPSTGMAARLRELRSALIGLLKHEALDPSQYTNPVTRRCSCLDVPGFPPPATCLAMRALRWGDHWDQSVFERRAAADRGLLAGLMGNEHE